MTKWKEEDKELLKSYEQGEWQSVKGLARAKGKYRQIARATFKKNKRVNIRISAKDLEALRKRALEEGIPYQTLIASVLHRYSAGTLVRKAA